MCSFVLEIIVLETPGWETCQSIPKEAGFAGYGVTYRATPLLSLNPIACIAQSENKRKYSNILRGYGMNVMLSTFTYYTILLL
jgi:hypothetical protein